MLFPKFFIFINKYNFNTKPFILIGNPHLINYLSQLGLSVCVACVQQQTGVALNSCDVKSGDALAAKRLDAGIIGDFLRARLSCTRIQVCPLLALFTAVLIGGAGLYSHSSSVDRD